MLSTDLLPHERPAVNLVVEPLELDDPVTVGAYRLRGRLGSGGMGMVFLAGDPDQPVAVKTMRAADLGNPSARARFRAEAECARRLSTSATPKVIADGSDEPVPYLVTEYISGPNIAQVVIKDGPLQADALYAVAIGVADALAEIHRAGIVHRDVKPSNVLLAEDGPKIIDFGIARQLDSTGGVTQTGMVMGSPGWVAPERLTGGPATPAADVFCWGMLVAYAATGRHPFGSGDASQVSERILTLSPDLTKLNEPLRGLVKAALSKDPAMRPKAAKLREALMSPRHEETASQAIQHLWTPQRPRRPRPHRLIPAKLALTCVGATAAVLLLLRGLTPTTYTEAEPNPKPTVTVTTGPGQTTPGRAVTDRAGPGQSGTGTRKPTPPVASDGPSAGPSASSKPSAVPTPGPSAPSPTSTPSTSTSEPAPAPAPVASTASAEPSVTPTKKEKKPKKPKKKDEEVVPERNADRTGTDFG
jgi:serine/threonine protein kinase